MECKNATLISDLTSSRKKQRSQIGQVQFTLDKNNVVKAVGAIYGIQHVIREPSFVAEIYLDHYNQRLRLLEYSAKNIDGMLARLQFIASENGFDKFIYVAQKAQLNKFHEHGFHIEAKIDYFFGKQPGYFLAKFLSPARQYSSLLDEEERILEKIAQQPRLKAEPRANSNYIFRAAQQDDIPKLLGLYRNVFETYPSPLIHRDYLESILQTKSIFYVAQNKLSDKKEIVAAASAEIYPGEWAAEMTDCATLQTHRGNGLMVHLLWLLEKELAKRNFTCAFTMARARSFGMNFAFHRLNYSFQGRSINACDIQGCYEDLNFWSKQLSRYKPRP